MAEFRVPKHREAGLIPLLRLTISEASEFANAIHNAPKGLNEDKLAEYLIEKEIISKKETFEVVRLISSLYRFKALERFSAGEISQGICDTLIEERRDELAPGDGDWDRFQKFLQDILSQDDTLGITFKALALALESEKHYVDSNIYTDIRPAFRSNVDDKFNTAVIIHNLKIEYHICDRHEEIYLTLDSEDLRNLRNKLERAEKKDRSIRKNLKEIIDFIVEEE